MTTFPHEPVDAGSRHLLSSNFCPKHTCDDEPCERPMRFEGLDVDHVRIVLEHAPIGHRQFMLEWRIDRHSRAILSFSIRPIDIAS